MARDLFMQRTSRMIQHHRQRAKAMGQHLDYSLSDLRSLIQSALCLPCKYCHCTIKVHAFSCDHSTPTSRGGSFKLYNVECICQRCNETKGCLTSSEFLAILDALSTMDSVARVDVLKRLRAGNRLYRRGS